MEAVWLTSLLCEAAKFVLTFHAANRRQTQLLPRTKQGQDLKRQKHKSYKERDWCLG